MICTIFKNLNTTGTPFFKEVTYVLKRIKEGVSKDVVAAVRSQSDKDKADEIKRKLPAICFSGTFNRRSDQSIVEHSGLICLDFDKYSSTDELTADYEHIKKDAFTYSCFISPSGNGIKVLVKIPKKIEYHKQYFDALEKYYNNLHFDPTSKNISRICFESYDPNIYINEGSKTWTEKTEIEHFDYRDKPPLVKLENENEIIKRLYKWFSKSHSMDKGSRNANLFILATAFSDYGVSEIETKRFCNQFEEKDFTGNEIERTITSAYSKCKANFGMKYFEDTELAKSIKTQIKAGSSSKEIQASYPKVEVRVIDEIRKDATSSDFWAIINGKIKIDNYAYKLWLESNGFYKYYPEGSDNFVFVKVTNNLIDNTSEVKIKDFVLDELLKINEYKVYEYFAANSRYFKDDYLNILSESSVFFREDTVDTAYIYFRNGAVKVTKDSIELIDYLELEGYVWKKHIIDFDFKSTDDISCDFNRFIKLVSNNEEDKEAAFCTTLGYLMHSYKTSANNKAVILNDETISENPNGGSGKGIFWNAIAQVKRVSDINGKSFSFDKSFPYQTVSADTQVLVFDDVQKNFKFENLFSVITEGITLEKKNKDAIKIPVSKSPKIVITTNYTLGGVGGSFERRKWELEFSSYFSSKHTPLNEFGRMLFDEWDATEWCKFYNYMLACLQYYLIHGLFEHGFKNLDIRKLIKETSYEFYEWANEPDTINFDSRINKTEFFSSFLDEYPDFKKWLSHKRFWQWMDIYCKYKKYNTTLGKSMDGRWIIIKQQEL